MNILRQLSFVRIAALTVVALITLAAIRSSLAQLDKFDPQKNPLRFAGSAGAGAPAWLVVISAYVSAI